MYLQIIYSSELIRRYKKFYLCICGLFRSRVIQKGRKVHMGIGRKPVRMAGF